MRVVSIGECMIELSDRQADRWRMGFAGDTFNTLWYLRALLPADTQTDYVSAFGDDPFSAEQIAFLSEHGIGIARSPKIAGAVPGLYAITLDARGERSFTYWRSTAAARRLADDPAALAASLTGADLIYFSGITLAILEPAGRRTLLTEFAKARKAGAIIAFDPNYRPRLWAHADEARQTIGAAYDVASLALPTFDDEAALFGDADAQATIARIAPHGPARIVVKAGSDAAVLYDGGAMHTIAPPETVEPVDTTGAGDSFNGAFLASLLTGASAPEATGYAHRIAGRVITHHGALMPLQALAALR
ncbi:MULTISPECIES: sugar kinase [unclassified Roseitalea]|uniref:sugar kinase n=1 Tax=unclassified Roseitalea TaxID=2639107 RepID=UPI00273DD84B|nr:MULTISPECIES: sugar kinase [unclassified Roseitalea]